MPTAALCHPLFPERSLRALPLFTQRLPKRAWLNHVQLLENIGAKTITRIRLQNALLKLGQNI